MRLDDPKKRRSQAKKNIKKINKLKEKEKTKQIRLWND